MSSLTLEQIDILLKGDKTKPFNLPIQVGPLSYSGEHTFTCSSRGCRGPCCIKIKGAPYCTTHALYVMNEMWLREHDMTWVIDECNCKSGKYSWHNIHSEDCPVYNKLKASDLA